MGFDLASGPDVIAISMFNKYKDDYRLYLEGELGKCAGMNWITRAEVLRNYPLPVGANVKVVNVSMYGEDDFLDEVTKEMQKLSVSRDFKNEHLGSWKVIDA